MKGNAAIKVHYDDRYTFIKEVLSFSNPKISSRAAHTDISDDAIVTLFGDSKTNAVITGVGEVTVNYADGSSELLVSECARLNVFFIAGQSNAEGADGNAYQHVVCPEGQVYSTYSPAYRYSSPRCPESEHMWGNLELFPEILTSDNAECFVARTLTSDENIRGDKLGYKLNALSENGTGKAGMDSAIADEWLRATGEKVWVVNCSHSGSPVEIWEPFYDDSEWISQYPDPECAENGCNSRRNQYKEMLGIFRCVKSTVEAEIAAGHYTLSHFGLFWCQGESNAGSSIQMYTQSFTNVYNAMKRDFVIDCKQIEFAALVLVRKFTRPLGYDAYTLEDIRLNGTRLAQYYMGLSKRPEYRDIYIATNSGDRWVGEDKFVSHYMDSVYGDEEFRLRFGYEKPRLMSEMHHDGAHYRQEGFNEMGADAARNMLSFLGITDKPVPRVDAPKGLPVPYINDLYDSGEFSDLSFEDFEALFRERYYQLGPFPSPRG